MTSGIIYHNFGKDEPVPAKPEPKIALTAAVLARGRKLAALNRGLNIACVAICGVCIGISIFIFGALFGGL